MRKLYEDFLQASGNLNKTTVVINSKKTNKNTQRGVYRWMTTADMLQKYIDPELVADLKHRMRKLHSQAKPQYAAHPVFKDKEVMVSVLQNSVVDNVYVLALSISKQQTIVTMPPTPEPTPMLLQRSDTTIFNNTELHSASSQELTLWRCLNPCSPKRCSLVVVVVVSCLLLFLLCVCLC
jgi:hypothetical protein